MVRNLRVQEGLGGIEAKVQESLAGIHVVKAYALEDHESELFRKANDDYNELGLALARLRGAMFPMIRGTSTVAVMVVLIYGGSLVTRGSLQLGDLVAFMGYLGQAGVAGHVDGLDDLRLSAREGRDEPSQRNFRRAAASRRARRQRHRLDVKGAVEWDHVSFSYFLRDGLRRGRGIQRQPDNGHYRYALKDVKVRVPAGGKLAIVGRTGSGKSTMVKLLTRLIEPTDGRVLLDGKDIRDLPLHSLRKTLGVVPQEPILFSDTLARNIAFGRPDASMAEIENAARVAGLEADIAVLPHGLDTVVGERGMSLSGGQKQRATIARLLTYGPEWWCWMTRFPASIPKPRSRFSTAWKRRSADGRRSWCRIAHPRCAMPTRSWCWKTGRSPSAERTSN